MTLRLDEEKGIKVVEVRETSLHGNDSMDFALLDRQNGQLLNGINFTAHRTRKRAAAGEGARIRI